MSRKRFERGEEISQEKARELYLKNTSADPKQGFGKKLPPAGPSDAPWYPAFLKQVRDETNEPS